MGSNGTLMVFAEVCSVFFFVSWPYPRLGPQVDNWEDPNVCKLWTGNMFGIFGLLNTSITDWWFGT